MTYLNSLFLVAAVALARGLDVTPMQQVVKLLSDLKAEVLAEGTEELIIYQNFSAFCKSTKTTKASAIQTGEDKVKTLESSRDVAKANYENKLADIEERKVRIETLSAKKDSRKKQCHKDRLASDANKMELTEAVSALVAAIDKVNRSSGAASGDASFMQLGSTLKLAQTLGFKLGQVQPWLEEEGAEYKKAQYAFQSGGIVTTLKSLHSQFAEEKEDAERDWTWAKGNCTAEETNLTTQIEAKTEGLSAAEQDAAAYRGQLAEFKGSLLNTKKNLEQDTKYHAELVENCEARDKDWKQRSAQRKDEAKALDGASDILSKEVEAIDQGVNTAGLAAKAASGKPPAAVQAGRRSFLQKHFGRGKSSSHSKLKDNVVSQLAAAARRFGSARLLGLSKRIQASSDPLETVKTMVNGMLKQLLVEDTEAVSEKGFCDTEMAKAMHDRQKFYGKVSKTNAQLYALDAKRSALTGEVDVLGDTISKLTQEHTTSTALRANESVANLKTIADSKAAVKAVEKALLVIKNFYKQAGKSFLQATPAVPEGTYKGKQTASTGIITMMEVCRDDFAHTASTTDAEEKEDGEEFAKLDEDTKADIAGKVTTKQLAAEDLASATNALQQSKLELKGYMENLDQSLQILEELKPRCVDAKESHQERQARQQGQIAALKKALCSLDPNGVEESCQ